MYLLCKVIFDSLYFCYLSDWRVPQRQYGKSVCQVILFYNLPIPLSMHIFQKCHKHGEQKSQWLWHESGIVDTHWCVVLPIYRSASELLTLLTANQVWAILQRNLILIYSASHTSILQSVVWQHAVAKQRQTNGRQSCHKWDFKYTNETTRNSDLYVQHTGLHNNHSSTQPI